MSGRGNAFMYFEPATRFYLGGVFADREMAVDWARSVAAQRGVWQWDLSVRLDGRWQRVGPSRALSFFRRRSAVSGL